MSRNHGPSILCTYAHYFIFLVLPVCEDKKTSTGIKGRASAKEKLCGFDKRKCRETARIMLGITEVNHEGCEADEGKGTISF